MIQGHKNFISSEGSQKNPEKSISPKLCTIKTLPEKTKFTLQYNAVNSQTMKSTDNKGMRSLTPQGSQVLRNSRMNMTVPRVKDARVKTVRDPKLSEKDPKQSQVNHERKISSLPFLTGPITGSKSSVTSGRKSIKVFQATKIPTDSKNGFLPSKRNNCPHTQKHIPLQCNAEVRTSIDKVENLKKSTTFASGMKMKESEKSTKNAHSVWKKTATSRKHSESRVTEGETAKLEDKAQINIRDRTRRKYVEEEGKMIAKERSRSHEVKRIPSEEISLKLCEIADKKRSEGKILFNGPGKNVSFTGLNERNWETESVAFDLQKKEVTPTRIKASPTPVSHNASIEEKTREKMFDVYDVEVAQDGLKLKKSKSNSISGTDDGNKKNGVISQNYQSPPVDNYDIFEPVEKRFRDEELLNLDKKIWSNLEVQIKETCEKTDFLCDSGDDSGESVSDIIHQLFSNREDDDLMEYIKTLKISNNSDCREEWNALNSLKSKSKHEICGRFPDKEKLKIEARKKDYIERPRSRRETEEPSGKKISQESKRTKSSEDSKLWNPKQEFRTISLNGEINRTNLLDDAHVRIVKERKTVNFQEDFKLGTKSVSSSFFDAHKNVGFIGKDVDEEYVSFEPGQVTLYQPHESQMLLYDIANCAATQGYLKMCGITYDVVIRKNAEQMSPSGKVPFICSSLCIIPEFEAIVSFLQYKKFACVPVKENDKSAFRAIISMIVNFLERAERYICWYDDTTLLKYTRPRTGGQYPFPLNHIMHWKKRHEERCRLTERGFPGKSFDAILNEINSCFQSLSLRLGNNSFFFGNVGTEVDALVFGHVYALFTAEVDGPLRDLQFIIQQYPNLISFACNFDKTFSLEKFSSIQQPFRNNILGDGGYPSDTSFTAKA